MENNDHFQKVSSKSNEKYDCWSPNYIMPAIRKATPLQDTITNKQVFKISTLGKCGKKRKISSNNEYELPMIPYKRIKLENNNVFSESEGNESHPGLNAQETYLNDGSYARNIDIPQELLCLDLYGNDLHLHPNKQNISAKFSTIDEYISYWSSRFWCGIKEILQSSMDLELEKEWCVCKVQNSKMTLTSPNHVNSSNWYNCPLHILSIEENNPENLFQFVKRYSLLLCNRRHLALFLNRISQKQFLVASYHISQGLNKIVVLSYNRIGNYISRYDTLKQLPQMPLKIHNLVIGNNERDLASFEEAYPYNGRHFGEKYFDKYHHLPKRLSEYIQENFEDEEKTLLFNLYKGIGIRFVNTVTGVRFQKILCGFFSLLYRRKKHRTLIITTNPRIAAIVKRIHSHGLYEGWINTKQPFQTILFGSTGVPEIDKYTLKSYSQTIMKKKIAEIRKNYIPKIDQLKNDLDKISARSTDRNATVYLETQIQSLENELNQICKGIEKKKIKAKLLQSSNLMLFCTPQAISQLPVELKDINFIISTEGLHEVDVLSLLFRFHNYDEAIFFEDPLLRNSKSQFGDALRRSGYPSYNLTTQYLYNSNIAALLKPLYPNIETHPNVAGRGQDIYNVDFQPFSLHNVQGTTTIDSSYSNFSNQREARFIRNILQVTRRRFLIKHVDNTKNWMNRILVVTPYSNQVKVIKEEISEFPNIDIKTIDEVYLKSYDIVIFSPVLSGLSNQMKNTVTDEMIGKTVVASRFAYMIVGDVEWLAANTNCKMWKHFLEASKQAQF